MTVRLALVGVPGSGTSEVAAELARAWNCRLLDSDQVYEERFGMPVSEAVIDAEDVFRNREEAIVLDSLSTDGAVVAVGSGAIASQAVRESLQDCPVVWLDIPVDEAARRNGLSVVRPAGLGNVRAQFLGMLRQRGQMYATVADLQVQAGGRDHADLAGEIITWEAGHDTNG